MSSTVLQFIGAKIRDTRRNKGITQEQLAEMAETHHSYIGGIERGERNATIQTLEKIAAALEVDFFELFQYGSEFSGAGHKNKQMQEIIGFLIGLNENELRRAYSILAEVYRR